MTSTPLRQFFPTLGVVILLGFFLYNMTAGTPGAQEADLSSPAAQAADVPTVITVRNFFPSPMEAVSSGNPGRPACMKKWNAAFRWKTAP